MRRIALIGLLGLGASCDLGIGSDPYQGATPLSCLPGHQRAAPDEACSLPSADIAIDGVTADWNGVAPVPVAPACVAPPCDGLLPATLQIAEGGPGNFRAPTLRVTLADGAAPPASDMNLRVTVVLRSPPERLVSSEIDTIIAGVDGVRYYKNGYDVTPASAPPYEFAWTADGWEVRVRDEWLPFQGAALLTTTVERHVGTSWVAVAELAPVPICWSGEPYDVDPCATKRPGQ